jgi:AcrR family transcriptional regulator
LDKRKSRGTATRQHIVEVATTLFAKFGFADTSIEDVLRESQVSRGALYHHFVTKEALFSAVLEQVERELCDSLQQAAKAATNPLDALRLGCNAWLDSALDPRIRQIALIDAPSVIGWTSWREIDSRNGLGLIKRALGIGVQLGRIPAPLVDMYAHMLVAALIELVLVIAGSDEKATLVEQARRSIEIMLSGIFGVEPNGAF